MPRSASLFCSVPLVPVFTFNEHRLLSQVRGSVIGTFQNWFRRVLGFVPVVPVGRGVFQYSFGAVPHRLPLTVVGTCRHCPVSIPRARVPLGTLSLRAVSRARGIATVCWECL